MTTATPLSPPEPPRVQLYGFEHLDVVRHVAGWTGTVHHDRRHLGHAEVRWHGSFAVDALGDVAPWLTVTARRSTRPATRRDVEPVESVEPTRVDGRVTPPWYGDKIDRWANKIDKILKRS